MPMTITAPARRWRLAAACMALLLPLAAQAQYIMEFAQTYHAPMSNFITGTVMNNQAMIAAADPGQRAPASAAPVRARAAPQTARNARLLAQRFPSEHRAKLEQLFGESYALYRKLEAKFGWQEDDLAGALTAFVIGNYMVFAATDVPDDHVVAVASQLRANPGMAATFRKVGTEDLRTMYEQSAMVGTFMVLTELSRAKQPQPPEVQARVRDAARANLQQVLGVDPARLRIGAGGMRLD